MPMMIENFRPAVKNTMRGYFSVRWPEAGALIVRDFTLHLSSGRWWIGFPSREYTDRNGEKKRWHFVSFPDRVASVNFQDECLAALRVSVPDVFAETGGPGSARGLEDRMTGAYARAAGEKMDVKLWPLDPDEPDDGVVL